MKRKIFTLFLIILAINIFYVNKAFAYTSKTADEAIEWANSKCNNEIGSGECVAFICAYFEALGVTCPSGIPSGAEFANADFSKTGWAKIKDAVPQKGDVLIYTGGSQGLGHVAVYESDDCTYHQNYNNIRKVQKVAFINYKKLYSLWNYWGVIRPDFNKDTTLPKIEDVYVDPTSVKSTEYTLCVKASDNVGVTHVDVYSWADTLGMDADSKKLSATTTNSNGYYEFKIKASDHHNQLDSTYTNRIFACDAAGNHSSGSNAAGYDFSNIPMNTCIEYSLGDFTARIVSSENSNLVVGTDGNTSGSNVLVKSKNTSDESQIWKFTKNDDRTSYTITNLLSGKVLDVYNAEDNQGTNIQIYDSNKTNAQKFYIMKYQKGYRLVPKCTKRVKALDINTGVITAGQNIQLWDSTNKIPNVAQRWHFEEVIPEINISKTSITLEEETSETLSANLTLLSNFKDSTLIWKSSNEAIATVNSNGTISGKTAGNAIITVYSKENKNIKATCLVTVTNKATSFSLNYQQYQINSLSEQLTLIGILDTGTKANLTWSSSNNEVATVDQNGVVTPVRGGFVNIIAKSERFGERKCWIYICTLIDLSDGSKAYAGDFDRNGVFNANDAANINNAFLYGTEDDILLGDIDGNGIVNANDTAIMLDFYKSGTIFKPGDYNPIQNITLNKTEIESDIGKTISLIATIAPIDTTDSPKLTWSSSNEKVAIVDNSGKVITKRAGNAIITVKTSNGKTATCNITVPGLVYTTIPTKEILEKDVMTFNSKTRFESILTFENFPILDVNYEVELYSESNNIKENKEKIGSKNIIKIKDTKGNVVAEYTTVVPGDVTGNGYSRMYDAFQILKDSINSKKIDEIDLLIRDYDGNGAVRMYDAFQFLKQAVLGK